MKVGDTVVLKTPSPAMTIISIEGDSVSVSYFDPAWKEQISRFPIACLIRVAVKLIHDSEAKTFSWQLTPETKESN